MTTTTRSVPTKDEVLGVPERAAQLGALGRQGFGGRDEPH